MRVITHTKNFYTGKLTQTVSPKRLRELLDEDNESYSRPSWFGPDDEWNVADEPSQIQHWQMSQVKFNTEYQGKKAVVMSGWDRPLGYYHLTIFDADPEAEEEVLWDGLGDLGFSRKLATVQAKLASLGVEPPPGFWELVDRREGNVFYFWDGDQWQRTAL